MSKRKDTPFHVVAGKHCSHDDENIKFADAYETFADAATMLADVDSYPVARIEFDGWHFELNGYAPSLGDNLFHVQAGSVVGPNDDEDSPTLDYNLTMHRLTTEWLTCMVVNAVDWIELNYRGSKYHVYPADGWLDHAREARR